MVDAIADPEARTGSESEEDDDDDDDELGSDLSALPREELEMMCNNLTHAITRWSANCTRLEASLETLDEQLVRKNEELEAANQKVAEFASCIVREEI